MRPGNVYRKSPSENSIDPYDWNEFLKHYPSRYGFDGKPYDPECDSDGDGDVDGADFNRLIANMRFNRIQPNDMGTEYTDDSLIVETDFCEI